MTDSDKKKITVEIYGKQYVLSSDQDSQYIERIALQVDTLMKKIGGGKTDDLNCSILTSMTLSDELEQARVELKQVHEEIENQEKKILGLSEILDNNLELNETSETINEADLKPEPNDEF